MFKGAGSYIDAEKNNVDAIICDEGHRLTAKTQLGPKIAGENQIIVDSPSEVRDLIVETNRTSNHSRILAGYCWEWIKTGKNDSTVHDIEIDDFEMSWNLGIPQHLR